MIAPIWYVCAGLLLFAGICLWLGRPGRTVVPQRRADGLLEGDVVENTKEWRD